MKPTFHNNMATQTQVRALGKYRNDVAYTAALKEGKIGYSAASSMSNGKRVQFSGAESMTLAPVFLRGGLQSLMAALSSLVFNDTGIKTLSELDQKSSMKAVAVRDLVDSSGRIYQEYKRNQHGGRESMIEELGTTVVWGWGIGFFKWCFDKGVYALNGLKNPLNNNRPLLNVQFPQLEMELISNLTQTKQPTLAQRARMAPTSAQHLSDDIVKRFWDEGLRGNREHLLELVNNKDLQLVYELTRWAKLSVAVLLPVLAIGLGIPTFNQWLTKKVLKREEEKFSLDAGYRFKGQPQLQSLRMKPSAFQAFQPEAGAPKVKFGNLLSTFLNNNALSTALFVDGPLVAGRVYKASQRNKFEMYEKIFREMAMVFFLFKGQGMIQDAIASLLDKTTQSVTGLGFNGLQFLSNEFKGKESDAFNASYQELFAKGGPLSQFATPEGKFDVSKFTISKKPTFQQTVFNLFGNKDKFYDPAEVAKVEKAYADLAQGLREYFHNSAGGARSSKNLLFDLAQATSKVNTVTEKVVRGEKLMSENVVNLDITRKMHLEEIVDLGGRLNKMHEILNHSNAAQPLHKFLFKSNMAKFGAFVASYAVCWYILSNLVPKIQHYITYLNTGKDEFPGVMPLNSQGGSSAYRTV